MPSFFNVYKKNLINSDHFEEYWKNLPDIITYADAVLKHEQIQTQHWQNLGFKEGAWIDDYKYKEFWEDGIWPLVCSDRLVIEDGFPFIKRRCFYVEDNPINKLELLKNIKNFLGKNTNYDIGLIFDNLKRTQNLNTKIPISFKLIKAFLLQNIHPKKENRNKYKMRVNDFFNHANYVILLKEMIKDYSDKENPARLK